MATGILPIIVGEGTKYISYVENGNKSYDVKCKLGVFSECGDFESEPIQYPGEEAAIKDLNDSRIKKTFKSFVGDYLQIPPMFSNTKHKGKPLHTYARKNIKIDREPKNRKIYDIKFNYLEHDILCFSVICSSGTYIRTLVQDISYQWNIHSCLYELHRSEVKPFNNFPLIDLERLRDIKLDEYIISIPQMLKGLEKLVFTDIEINKLYKGIPIVIREGVSNHSLYMITDKNNNFHGVGTIANNSIYPKRLMKR